MKTKLFILFLILILGSMSLVSSEVQTLGTFKQGECISLVQSCADCSYVNITAVTLPDSSTLLHNVIMTNPTPYKYNYTFCNTTQVGKYIVDNVADPAGAIGTYGYDFYITPSGAEIDSGKSINLFGSLLLIIIIGIVFFFIAYKSANTVAKISFYVASVIVLIISVLYIVIIMQQTLFGFESILTGIESFWFVIKIGLTIGSVAFGIIIFLILLKAWKIKRGLYDIE